MCYPAVVSSPAPPLPRDIELVEFRDAKIFAAAGECLGCTDVDRKLALAAALADDWRTGGLERDPTGASDRFREAGRPARPDGAVAAGPASVEYTAGARGTDPCGRSY